MNGLTYREPRDLGRADLARSLVERDIANLREAIVAVALRDPDRAWVEDQLMTLMHDSEGSVRSVAALAAGHLARIHHAIDQTRLVPALRSLLRDPDARENAENALDDIATFARDAAG
ncbi:hypothetical protein [Cellulomonas telluris]|uniref:hypothetical protein n=1 Tax=Cellulomonas telluris TaxID=2306636 RepID=UPI0010A8A461|nr:hypothetical protein [Cellulomonas telluris]